MIHQIAYLPTKTEPLPKIDRTAFKVHHIQARLKASHHAEHLPKQGLFWSPATAGPVMVPILNWFD